MFSIYDEIDYKLMMRIYNEELDWDLFDKTLESEMCNMEIWRLKLKCLMYDMIYELGFNIY